jgi:phosphate transport system substrate-binding protein
MATGAANASAAGLTGAGSTLVAPLMANWINGFEIKEGIPVKYGAVGSGAGIAQITARTVDFGASDAPLTPEQAAACNNCVQIPWGLSAVGISYKLPGIRKLNLTGSLLASIYFGKITKWNDPKIKALNPGVKLPGLTITPVFRSDGSGTTYGFVRYLSKDQPGLEERSRLRDLGQLPDRSRRQRQRRCDLHRHQHAWRNRLHRGLLHHCGRSTCCGNPEQGWQV